MPGAANHLRRMQQGRPKTPREASVVSKRAARLGAFEVQLCFVRDGRLECAHREFELHSTSFAFPMPANGGEANEGSKGKRS